MDMASLISDMAVEPQASPSSPEARASSALEAAPDMAVARRTQVRKAKRCLAEAFGEKKWPRAPSPDEDPPLLLLSPRRVSLADVDMVQQQGQGVDKGNADYDIRHRLTLALTYPLPFAKDDNILTSQRRCEKIPRGRMQG
jgi:hypothetical protein